MPVAKRIRWRSVARSARARLVQRRRHGKIKKYNLTYRYLNGNGADHRQHGQADGRQYQPAENCSFIFILADGPNCRIVDRLTLAKR